MTSWRLVCDVGGTNVRFARAFADGGLHKKSVYPVSCFDSFRAALGHYIDETGGVDGCNGAAIGAAGPVRHGTVRLTNAAWVVSAAETSAVLDVPCTLINDVQATAFSLPALSDADFRVLGSLAPDLRKARRLLTANMGTGFGAATLIKTANAWVVCPSEAGHMSLAFSDWPLECLRQNFLSVEHVLSGGGLSRLHYLLSDNGAELPCSEIFERLAADKNCAVALHLFTKIAGNLLGDLTLAVAAWDGVFLCGSVAQAFAAAADIGLFREALEDKGPMSELMKQVPIAVITKADAPLSGLGALPLYDDHL